MEALIPGGSGGKEEDEVMGFEGGAEDVMMKMVEVVVAERDQGGGIGGEMIVQEMIDSDADCMMMLSGEVARDHDYDHDVIDVDMASPDNDSTQGDHHVISPDDHLMSTVDVVIYGVVIEVEMESSTADDRQHDTRERDDVATAVDEHPVHVRVFELVDINMASLKSDNNQDGGPVLDTEVTTADDHPVDVIVCELIEIIMASLKSDNQYGGPDVVTKVTTAEDHPVDAIDCELIDINMASLRSDNQYGGPDVVTEVTSADDHPVDAIVCELIEINMARPKAANQHVGHDVDTGDDDYRADEVDRDSVEVYRGKSDVTIDRQLEGIVSAVGTRLGPVDYNLIDANNAVHHQDNVYETSVEEDRADAVGRDSIDVKTPIEEVIPHATSETQTAITVDDTRIHAVHDDSAEDITPSEKVNHHGANEPQSTTTVDDFHVDAVDDSHVDAVDDFSAEDNMPSESVTHHGTREPQSAITGDDSHVDVVDDDSAKVNTARHDGVKEVDQYENRQPETTVVVDDHIIDTIEELIHHGPCEAERAADDNRVDVVTIDIVTASSNQDGAEVRQYVMSEPRTNDDDNRVDANDCDSIEVKIPHKEVVEEGIHHATCEPQSETVAGDTRIDAVACGVIEFNVSSHRIEEPNFYGIREHGGAIASVDEDEDLVVANSVEESNHHGTCDVDERDFDNAPDCDSIKVNTAHYQEGDFDRVIQNEIRDVDTVAAVDQYRVDSCDCILMEGETFHHLNGVDELSEDGIRERDVVDRGDAVDAFYEEDGAQNQICEFDAAAIADEYRDCGFNISCHPLANRDGNAAETAVHVGYSNVIDCDLSNINIASRNLEEVAHQGSRDIGVVDDRVHVVNFNLIAIITASCNLQDEADRSGIDVNATVLDNEHHVEGVRIIDNHVEEFIGVDRAEPCDTAVVVTHHADEYGNTDIGHGECDLIDVVHSDNHAIDIERDASAIAAKGHGKVEGTSTVETESDEDGVGMSEDVEELVDAMDRSENDSADDMSALLLSITTCPLVLDPGYNHTKLIDRVRLECPQLSIASVPVSSERITHEIAYPLPVQTEQEFEERLKELHCLQERKRESDMRRIEALHHYNDIKDIAQQLIGRLAEQECVPSRALYARYGISPDSD